MGTRTMKSLFNHSSESACLALAAFGAEVDGLVTNWQELPYRPKSGDIQRDPTDI